MPTLDEEGEEEEEEGEEEEEEGEAEEAKPNNANVVVQVDKRIASARQEQQQSEEERQQPRLPRCGTRVLERAFRGRVNDNSLTHISNNEGRGGGSGETETLTGQGRQQCRPRQEQLQPPQPEKEHEERDSGGGPQRLHTEPWERSHSRTPNMGSDDIQRATREDQLIMTRALVSFRNEFGLNYEDLLDLFSACNCDPRIVEEVLRRLKQEHPVQREGNNLRGTGEPSMMCSKEYSLSALIVEVQAERSRADGGQ
eukprot:GHVU01227349.1.p1 GENE.GHVU01227349.1~~GHVU01227349.1.p1  ORF type:complete len:255 (+),score=57.73 GHVU01227349.1:1015-1779(+)